MSFRQNILVIVAAFALGFAGTLCPALSVGQSPEDFAFYAPPVAGTAVAIPGLRGEKDQISEHFWVTRGAAGGEHTIPKDWLAVPPSDIPSALYPRPALGDPIFQAEIDGLCTTRKPQTVALPLAEVLASPTRIKKGRMLPEKHVILSFDDGPNDPLTALVLDMLARCKVKAHFFVVGELAALPEHRPALQRFLEMGHIVGSHSYSHANLQKVSLERARREIEVGHRLLERALGERTPFFRFPFGAGSTSRKLRAILQENGLVSMGWTMSAYDTVYRKPNTVLFHSLSHFLAKQKGGVIFLAHDRKEQTVRMLPHLLSFLVDQGYIFVTVLPTENPYHKNRGVARVR